MEGKIVVCNTSDPYEIFDAVTEVNRTGGQLKEVVDYIKSTETATGNLLETKAIDDVTAPNVASFSARGPNYFFPDILKPAITAPGVEIFAPFSPAGNPSGFPTDQQIRGVRYDTWNLNFVHKSKLVPFRVYINPSWSPSAIKSALMTTGHLNPKKAPYPGLVYETLRADYFKCICGKNLSTELNVSCAGVVLIEDKDLNHPTMTAKVEKGKSFNVTFTRTVTNVGPDNSIYNGKSILGSLEDITLDPYILSFKARNEKKSFQLIVAVTEFEGFGSASIQWFDEKHTARSPIVVFTD
ncbi:OLC1v1001340C1 [Oldenlandia corymbosa var. corymbosa]|uniref:OLC1v1001340C1 n=1 Tax=Oldenlandia corymbosa var. corymbosa TaxID=529605 RepID=A0AAV1D7U1_OLDCO|nr:OLC1v1001340C1 [Oldenlandia corymbosa var. corymbosa]